MTQNAIETDFQNAPSLVSGALSLQLTAAGCDMEYWIQHVAQGTLGGLVHGHRADSRVPEHMMRNGPLRQAILEEFAFRSVSEEMGTRAISHLVRTAPTWATMDFYSTQLLDEARHAAIFRNHMLELGISKDELESTIEELAGEKRRTVLEPLQHYALEQAGGKDDFIIGVAMLTVIVEGVLAPAAELSERKWMVLDPPAAETARGANIDEVRHLAVGSSILREHLLKRPDDKVRVMQAIGGGLELWKSLPIRDVIIQREMLFQQGIAELASFLGDTELIPGRRLVDTTVEERLGLQMQWSAEMQKARMAYMGVLPSHMMKESA